LYGNYIIVTTFGKRENDIKANDKQNVRNSKRVGEKSIRIYKKLKKSSWKGVIT
jgi:hypothetical protein